MATERGQYRVKGIGGLPNEVRVAGPGGSYGREISEDLYRQREHQPPLEELPWRDDYFAAQQVAKDKLKTEG